MALTISLNLETLLLSGTGGEVNGQSFSIWTRPIDGTFQYKTTADVNGSSFTHSLVGLISNNQEIIVYQLDADIVTIATSNIITVSIPFKSPTISYTSLTNNLNIFLENVHSNISPVSAYDVYKANGSAYELVTPRITTTNANYNLSLDGLITLTSDLMVRAVATNGTTISSDSNIVTIIMEDWTESSSYTLPDLIGKDLGLNYNIYNLLNKNLDLSYNIYNLLNKDFQLNYNVYNLLNSSPLEIKYNIYNLLNATPLTINYNIYNLLSKSTSINYNIRGLLNKDLSLIYNITSALLGKDLSVSYNIRELLQKDVIIQYSILEPTVVLLTKDLNMAYNIRGLLSKSLSLRYKILSNQILIGYPIRVFNGKKRKFVFMNRGDEMLVEQPLEKYSYEELSIRASFTNMLASGDYLIDAVVTATLDLDESDQTNAMIGNSILVPTSNPKYCDFIIKSGTVNNDYKVQVKGVTANGSRPEIVINVSCISDK